MITITKTQEIVDDVEREARYEILADNTTFHVYGRITLTLTLPEARELLEALQSKLSNDKEIH